MKRLLTLLVLALCPSIVLAAPAIQTGAPAYPSGAPKELQAFGLFVQTCNSGAGGFVGQTYTDGVCSQPGGGGGGGGGGAVTAATGSYVTGFSPDVGKLADPHYAGTGTAGLVGIGYGLYDLTNTLFKSGQSIGNTSFGISGTLPAYAATPTFKIDQTTPGTTNGVVVNSSALPTGAATSANQTTELSTLATISGQLPASLGAKASASSLSIAPATDATFVIGGAAAAASTAAGNPLRNGCDFVTTQAVYTTTNIAPLQCDNRGDLKVVISNGNSAAALDATSSFGGSLSVTQSSSANALAAPLLATSSAVASAITAKSSAGNMYGYQVTTGASNGYIMAFNATTAPADGAVTPIWCTTVAANSTIFTPMIWPISFSTGITLVFSTTGCFSKTASATAFFSVQYR